jgi:deoxyguanosine kinase
MAPGPSFAHIAVEGPIGAGKSTLARALCHCLDAQLLLERPQDNPFLSRFYADGSRYAFQTQICFLFQRVEQMRDITQRGMFTSGLVSDFMFDKDALFARLTLSDDEYRLYLQIHGSVAPRLPQPDLVIWLQAGPAVLMQRIRQRGRGMEQDIDVEYLERQCAAYAAYFDHHPDLPVLVLDSEHFDPAPQSADMALLVEQLRRYRGPREVYERAVTPGAGLTG